MTKRGAIDTEVSLSGDIFISDNSPERAPMVLQGWKFTFEGGKSKKKSSS